MALVHTDHLISFSALYFFLCLSFYAHSTAMTPPLTHRHTHAQTHNFFLIMTWRNLLSWVNPDSNYPSQSVGKQLYTGGRPVRQRQHRVLRVG